MIVSPYNLDFLNLRGRTGLDFIFINSQIRTKTFLEIRFCKDASRYHKKWVLSIIQWCAIVFIGWFHNIL